MLKWLNRLNSAAVESTPLRTPEVVIGAKGSEAADDPAELARCAAAAAERGDLGLAKKLYGRAIDGWIAAGELDRAAAVCEELLRADPGVLRARCTLTFLAIASRDLGAIRSALSGYVDAVRRGGAEAYAGPALQLMGRATADPTVKGWIADALCAVGEGTAAELMRRHAIISPALQKLIDGGGLDRWRGLLGAATTAAHIVRDRPPVPPAREA